MSWSYSCTGMSWWKLLLRSSLTDPSCSGGKIKTWVEEMNFVWRGILLFVNIDAVLHYLNLISKYLPYLWTSQHTFYHFRTDTEKHLSRCLCLYGILYKIQFDVKCWLENFIIVSQLYMKDIFVSCRHCVSNWLTHFYAALLSNSTVPRAYKKSVRGVLGISMRMLRTFKSPQIHHLYMR